MSTRADMLTTIEELCFACLELNLYLDNHPDDKMLLICTINFAAN